MIPFYIYYSKFGFQRVGDLIWAAGDMQAKGFLIGGTAGRTTLNGEGLQHEDGDTLDFTPQSSSNICAAFSTSLRMVPLPSNCTCASGLLCNG
jgi:pyruvate dehydrogenase complex dehydrogenase (E1) component